MDRKTYVLYHGNCYDGFAAAWVAWKYHSKESIFIPCLYGTPMPIIEDGSRVFILDFSYPRQQLIDLAARCEVTVLDHHKSAKADLEGLDFCKFDMEKSGAVMAWNYFHPDDYYALNPVPLILYIQDRDLWEFKLPLSVEVSIALRSYPFEFRVFEVLMFQDIKQLQTEGTPMKKLQDQFVETMCKQAVMVNIGGHVVPVVNATVAFSECGEYLCMKYPDAPFAAYYLDRADGKRQWGLRSRNGFDVSEVAKLYGGGGHPGAAGFVQDIGVLSIVVPAND